MDVPKITTGCPDCKPLLEQQLAIIDALVKQIENLTKRLEKVEREGKRQAAPFAKDASPIRRSPDERLERTTANTIAELPRSKSTKLTMFRCQAAAPIVAVTS